MFLLQLRNWLDDGRGLDWLRFKLRYRTGRVEIGCHLDMRCLGVVDDCLQLVDLPEESSADDTENDNTDGETDDDDHLNPVLEEVFIDGALPLIVSVFSDHCSSLHSINDGGCGFTETGIRVEDESSVT